MAFICNKIFIWFTFLLAVDCVTTGIEKDEAIECAVLRRNIEMESSRSPLILQPNRHLATTKTGSHMVNVLSFLYPTKDTNCYYATSRYLNPVMRVACPDSFLWFPNDTQISKARATTLYYNDGFIKASESPEGFQFESGSLKCSDEYDPLMKEVDGKYEVGYQMNILDFLPVFEIIYDVSREIKVMSHAKIISILNARASLTERVAYNIGLKFDKIGYADLLEFYTLEYQVTKFQALLPDTLLNQYYKGENYLMPGQLVSSDDFYYNPEQRATFYYENTVPIWKSIVEGNWKLVGHIIRKLAQETKTDFEILAGTIGQLTIDKLALNIGALAYDNIPVPMMLFKIIVDVSEPKRGIVFITLNDPTIRYDIKEMFVEPHSPPIERIVIDDFLECKTVTECEKYYAEFVLYRKGFTYCCELEDFNYWNQVKGFLTVVR